MPAYAEFRGTVRPRERLIAAAAVILVQAALGFALLIGLRVQILTHPDVAQRLIEIALPSRPRPSPPKVEPKPARSVPAAPKATAALPGGPRAPAPIQGSPSVTPVVPIRPSVAPAGGGSARGPAAAAGSGGGAGGQSYGAGEGGGTDLEQIAGEITPRDYPRHLGNAGIGGRVGVLFTVGVDGRVTRCTVTRTSGIPELDALTCRLIQQRFRYRPSTDRYGRPVSDEVEGEHEWVASRG
jgi:protein TonB